VIIVPDIPWIDKEQLAAVRAYKEQGGKVYVMGSCEDLQELATINTPASYCHDTQKDHVRKEFLSRLNELLPQRIIQMDNVEYVLVNVVQKTNSNQVIIHMVNYLNSVKDIRVSVNLEGIVKDIDARKIRIYSPDGVPGRLGGVVVSDNQVEFVIPELQIYDMIVINE
jgi:hypothetical protein